MTDDTYNGWVNRETWLMALWLGNEQGTDELARGVVAENLSDEGTVTGCGKSWGAIEAGYGHSEACPIMGPPPAEAYAS